MSSSSASDPTRILEFRPSTKAFLLKSGGGWLFLIMSVPAFMITLPLLAIWWLRNKTTHYRMDSERLFIRSGIIFRQEDEIELYRVKDIKVHFSFIQQMFNCGTIAIISSDFTGERLSGTRRFATSHEIKHVPAARQLREDLRNRVERMRGRTRTREID
ncbi:PH domain-containing protein [Sphingomonas sp. IC081]|uniref:PH domain-containing protein n=1 Tax=Sphingomonas sp. IC081 TaxID=304378 RepID=UPI00163C2C53|nr:PH domain-containing protein [Sphingomonas sp. IC081]